MVPRVPLPRRRPSTVLRLPGRLCATPSRAAGDGDRRVRRAGRRRLRRLRRRRPPTSRRAAAALPVVVHEQNARPGLANRLGARWARAVAVTFPGTPLPGAQVTGLPLRAPIARAGGSSGSADRAGDARRRRRRARPRPGPPDAPGHRRVARGRERQHRRRRRRGGPARRGRPGAAPHGHRQGRRRARRARRRARRRALPRAGVPDRDAARAGRRGPRRRAVRRRHGVRAGRARHPGRLRAAARSATASSASTPPPSSRGRRPPRDRRRPRPRAGCARTSCPLLADRSPSSRRMGGRGGRRRAGRSTAQRGSPTSSSARPRAERASPDERAGRRVDPRRDRARPGPPRRGRRRGHVGVAALLAARGVVVSGSDARDSAVVAALRDAGVDVHVGHDAAHVAGADTVVVSTRGARVQPRARARPRPPGCACCTAPRRSRRSWPTGDAVAVAGAHGKTTTSAMVAVALLARRAPTRRTRSAAPCSPPDRRRRSGHRPARRRAARRRCDVRRRGRRVRRLVPRLRPLIAVVTNVEPDHLDHYGTARGVRGGVRRVRRPHPARRRARRVRRRRRVAAPARRRPRPARRAGRARRHVRHDADRGRRRQRVLRADPAPGRACDCDRAPRPRGRPAGAVVDLASRCPARTTRSTPPRPGPRPGCLDAAPADVRRRLSLVPRHRPAVRGPGHARPACASSTTTPTTRPRSPPCCVPRGRSSAGGRVVVLFQPHLYSRTRTFAAEFARGARPGRRSWSSPTSTPPARTPTRRSPARSSPTACRRPGSAGSCPTAATPPRAVAAPARPGDLVLTVGAGDVTELAPVVLAALAARADEPDRSTR